MTEALAAGLAHALGLAGPEAVRGLKRLSGGASQETWAFEALRPDGRSRRRPYAPVPRSHQSMTSGHWVWKYWPSGRSSRS